MQEQRWASSSYRDAGVDYDLLDAGKRLAVAAALQTSPLMGARDGEAIDASRGEPAFVFRHRGVTLATVIECLGTKSIIAREIESQLGLDRYAAVAYDTVAAIVNDLCCVGALPLVVSAYFATGSSGWYSRGDRGASLVHGWRRACEDAGCAWGGGESPALRGLLAEQELELAGSAVGAVPSGRAPILGEELRAGDEIVLVASSGLHANGASLGRMIAAELPDRYATVLADGQTLGEALLRESRMYVALVESMLAADVPISYLSHITGHGLLKLMRAKAPLTYRIRALPAVPAVLSFLVQHAGMDSAQAYSTFNMGVGFAVYCRPGAAERVVALAGALGLDAICAGVVEDGPREVVLEPVRVSYSSEQLQLS